MNHFSQQPNMSHISQCKPLDLPQGAVERFRRLIDWRYGQEVHYTLTDKALAMLAYRGKDEAV